MAASGKQEPKPAQASSPDRPARDTTSGPAKFGNTKTSVKVATVLLTIDAGIAVLRSDKFNQKCENTKDEWSDAAEDVDCKVCLSFGCPSDHPIHFVPSPAPGLSSRMHDRVRFHVFHFTFTVTSYLGSEFDV